MKLRNAPAGWAAFRALRQKPATILPRRHGNWVHGNYSRQRIEGLRLVRACSRIMRRRPRRLTPQKVEVLVEVIRSEGAASRGRARRSGATRIEGEAEE